jgi:hypothetical protein
MSSASRLIAADVVRHGLRELLGRPTANLVVQCRDLIAQPGIAEGRIGEFVPARNHSFGGAGRRREPAPGEDLKPRIAELRHGRHIGESWRALEAGGCEGSQRAVGNVRRGCPGARDHELRVPAQQRHQRRWEPCKRQVHGNIRRQSGAVKHAHGREMVWRAITAGREIELAGSVAQHLQQLRHAAHGQFITHQQHQRGIGHQHDRDEVLDRIVGQVALERWHRAMGAGGHHDERMAVRRRLLCSHDADDAGCAAAVVGDDRPAALRCDPLRDEPRDAVIRPARWIGHHDADRLCRIGLVVGSRRDDPHPCKDRGQDEELGGGAATQRHEWRLSAGHRHSNIKAPERMSPRLCQRRREVENVAAHKGCGTASRALQRISRHSLCHAGANQTFVQERR